MQSTDESNGEEESPAFSDDEPSFASKSNDVLGKAKVKVVGKLVSRPPAYRSAQVIRYIMHTHPASCLLVT
jgi:hypothetical protein